MPQLQGEGNKLLTSSIIANDVLARWKNDLVLTKSVYRDLEGQFGQIGQKINVDLPTNVIVNKGRVATTSTPLYDKTVAVEITEQDNIAFTWTTKDKKLSIRKFGDRYIAPATSRLANEIDMFVSKQMQKAYFQFGTVGSPLTNQDVTLGGAYARDVAIPCDSLVRLITNTIDSANLTIQRFGLSGNINVGEAIAKGYAGEVAGFENMFSQNIMTHTVGTHAGTETVATAITDGNQLDVAGSAVGAFVENDRFTIDGVKEVNPITKLLTGRLQVFTVVSTGGLAGATGTITISPSINNGTSTGLDGMGGTVTTAMDQNVAGSGIVGAAITVIGDAGGTYRENYIMHRDAIALCVVGMEGSGSNAAHMATAHDPQSGLSVTTTEYFEGREHKDNLRLDVLYGGKIVRPDLIFRATNEKIG